MVEVSDAVPAVCERMSGGSIRDCGCRLPAEGGWLECPDEARCVLPKRAARRQVATGDSCASCGSFNMVRAGTCLLCRDCGDTSGGCS